MLHPNLYQAWRTVEAVRDVAERIHEIAWVTWTAARFIGATLFYRVRDAVRGV
jgi:uncharacterized membrane protein